MMLNVHELLSTIINTETLHFSLQGDRGYVGFPGPFGPPGFPGQEGPPGFKGQKVCTPGPQFHKTCYQEH